MDRTDAELLALIREGDREAKKVFAERHLKWASAYARKRAGGSAEVLGEDVAQEALMSALASPPSDLRYSSAKPYLRGAISRICSRLGVAKPVDSISRESSLVDQQQTSPSAIVAKLEPLSAAQRAIARLPTPERVVVLGRADGLTFGDISRITGRLATTERSSHRRAIEKLRRELQDFLPPQTGR